MSKRKAKPRRDLVAATYGKFVLAIGQLIELRDLCNLTDDERRFLDCAYQFAGDARSSFEQRTGARQAWDEEWSAKMRTAKQPVALVDDEPAPIVASDL